MGRSKILWGIIFVLVLLNVSTFAYFKSLDQEAQPDTYGQDGAIAKVGNEKITTKEFIDRLVYSYGETVLEDMINRKLILSEAKRLQISVSEEEVDKEIESLRQDYETEEQFYDSLAHQVGISQEELRDEIRYYLLMEEMATKDIVVSEEEMMEYYEENIDSYYVPARFHLHRIIVATEADALQVIQEIEEGSSFEAAAAEHSLDMITAADGGDLGMVAAQDFFLPYEIIQVAEELPLNTVSQPIQTEEGYAIIKITDRTEGKQLSYDEVNAKIRRELALKQIDGVSSFLEKLKENVGVKTYWSKK